MSILRTALAALVAAFVAAPAAAQLELKIMAPAAPGGGWDQTARAMQHAMVAAGVAKSVQVTNVPGAGGTVGLAQLASAAKGDGAQLMVNGFVMVGAILANKSPVTLEQTTPIARLTGEYLASWCRRRFAIGTVADLAAAVKADPGKVPGPAARPAASTTSPRRCSPRPSAAIRPGSTTSPSPAAARRSPPSRRQGHGRRFRSTASSRARSGRASCACSP
jgi:tripartite-type tricarboxylate transporter receptor subunit TctC